jgi:glycosyltransferase involved in cell wall biosynthesis/SAM-dependent methyltransferase
VTAKTPNEDLRPDRLVGVEARKLYATKLEDGFIAKYLSGSAVLDIGYRGYEPDVVPIVPQAVGVDLDYPGYDGKTLPFADNSQDTVFSSHCLEHAQDCEAAIKDWFRVLKVDGYLVLAVPHKYLYERRHRPPSRWNIDHRRFFTPATLLLRIESALEPNSYRVRRLIDNDFAFGYGIPPDSHPGGCYEIELVIQKITPPDWLLENPSLLERRALVAPLQSPSLEAASKLAQRGRIVYDGLNLALSKGTGIATYTKTLAETATDLGYDVGVVYETASSIPKDPQLQDVLFFDQAEIKRPHRKPLSERLSETLSGQFRRYRNVKALPVSLGAAVHIEQFTDKLPTKHQAFAARDVFAAAERHFNDTGGLLDIKFDQRPNIFHCTYPCPLEVRQACNIYTIHDLVPLRLPRATLDNKRAIYNRLKVIVAKADHLVTVSEASKRDIVELLGVPESRITNTYQAVTFPPEDLCRSEEMIADYLAGLYGLDMQRYLLFFGALEPKKNVARLIDAYLSSGVEVPLVLVTGEGWQNEEEIGRLNAHTSRGSTIGKGPTIRRLEYTTRSNLISLIRGARAVVFPSLMEGFGLPVLESMTLGTPVLTSSNGALAEIAGDAAMIVDPYNVDAIARGICALANDTDLCGELSQRGLVQADRFSLSRYQERVRSLYAALV